MNVCAWMPRHECGHPSTVSHFLWSRVSCLLFCMLGLLVCELLGCCLLCLHQSSHRSTELAGTCTVHSRDLNSISHDSKPRALPTEPLVVSMAQKVLRISLTPVRTARCCDSFFFWQVSLFFGILRDKDVPLIGALVTGPRQFKGNTPDRLVA